MHVYMHMHNMYIQCIYIIRIYNTYMPHVEHTHTHTHTYTYTDDTYLHTHIHIVNVPELNQSVYRDRPIISIT